MLHLTQTPCSPHLERYLTPLPGLFGRLIYVSFAYGSGHWDSILGGFDDRVVHFEFADDPDVEAPMEELGARARSHFGLAIAAIHKHHQAIEGEDHAIIIRQHAYIMLSPWQSGAHQYVPMPGLTAHELLEDQVRLEREFPGAFKVS